MKSYVSFYEYKKFIIKTVYRNANRENSSILKVSKVKVKNTWRRQKSSKKNRQNSGVVVALNQA